MIPKPLPRPKQKCPRCVYQTRSLAALNRHVTRCGLPPKKNKFNARKTVTKGGAFPSRLEADVYQKLMLMKAAGELADVNRYPTWEAIPGVRWKIDFEVTLPDGSKEFHEAKGVTTGEYRVKRNAYEIVGEHKLHIWKDSGTMVGPVIVETIRPKRMRLVPMEVREFREGGEE